MPIHPRCRDASPGCSAGPSRASGTRSSCARCSLPIGRWQKVRGRKDRVAESGLLACRGYHQQLLGNMDEARQDYDAALTLARRLGDERQRADILNLRGEMYSYQGELAEGLMELIDAHRRYEALGLENKGREVLARIANAYRRMGLFERAEGYFQELEHDYRTLGMSERLVDIHTQQGLLDIDTAEYDKALPLMVGGRALL